MTRFSLHTSVLLLPLLLAGCEQASPMLAPRPYVTATSSPNLILAALTLAQVESGVLDPPAATRSDLAELLRRAAHYCEDVGRNPDDGLDYVQLTDYVLATSDQLREARLPSSPRTILTVLLTEINASEVKGGSCSERLKQLVAAQGRR